MTLLGFELLNCRAPVFFLLVGGLEPPIYFTLVAIMKFTHLQRQIISMSWHEDRIMLKVKLCALAPDCLFFLSF